MAAAKSFPPLLTVREPPLSMVAAETLPPLMTTSALPDVSVYTPEDVVVETDVVVMEAPAVADRVCIASQTGLYFVTTCAPLLLDIAQA
jgi:hypothetical protein